MMQRKPRYMYRRAWICRRPSLMEDQMKQILPYVFVLAVMTACEKQASVEGQVFVVTKSRENIKLALVEVKAIPADKLPDFAALQVKGREEQERMKDKVERAKLELNFAAASLEVSKLLVQHARSQKDVETAHSDAVKVQAGAADARKIMSEYQYFATPRFYIDQLPPALATAKTDADGKFKLVIPAGKYVIAATSSRSVGKETENYDWLVKVDATSPVQSLMLSNDNQVETKCKECIALPN